MENHPIPQDITGFQFKLIGDMTIKQFAYLASGSVLAWIAFSLPAPFLIKLPFITIFLVFGISFAFFSIEGRPVDTMVVNFIKAAFSPTQYVYQKNSLNFSQNEMVNDALSPTRQAGSSFQLPQHPIPKDKLEKKEFDFFNMLSQMLNPSTPSQTVQGPVNHSKPYIVTGYSEEKARQDNSQINGAEEKIAKVEKTEEPKLQTLTQESQTLEQRLEEAKELEKKEEGSANYEGAHQKVLELEKLLNDTMSEKQKLEEEIINLKKQLASQNQEVFRPSIATETKQTKNVRIIPKELGKSAGLPITSEFPNVISGIIKDPRGNPLPNILVEVKDQDGNPVRAFKTNALGQFSASTPLVNGSYTISFEDPNASNKFDTVVFEASGNIILPIEVISVDTREELRKSLFN